MPDLRKAVLAELKRREWSHYDLVQALKGKGKKGKDVPPATVYEFLRSETEINSLYLGAMFDVLGLTVVPALLARPARRQRKGTR